MHIIGLDGLFEAQLLRTLPYPCLDLISIWITYFGVRESAKPGLSRLLSASICRSVFSLHLVG